MFFPKSPEQIAQERSRRFAERTVKKFCNLAMKTNMTPEKQLKSVNITLDWLDQFLNRFEIRKAGLQKARETLQTSALARDNKSAFNMSTAMNSIIACLSQRPKEDEKKDEQALRRKQCFIDSMQLAVECLQERKAELEQQLSATQSQSPPQSSSSLSMTM